MNIQGGGFDCADNSTSGDGEWNNLVSQRQWIRQQMQAGGPTGLSKFAKFVKFVKFVMFFTVCQVCKMLSTLDFQVILSCLVARSSSEVL